MKGGILGASAVELESSPTRWYVVFCPSSKRHWWDKLLGLEADFGHVYAVRWDGYNWILFDPHAAFTDISIVAAVDERALAELVDKGSRVLEVEAFRAGDSVRGRWWVGPMSCVEQVKALLGLPVGWIFTPWQLYLYLGRCADERHNPRIRCRRIA